MTRPPFNVLFLCIGNLARSILAESLVNHWGGGRFRGYSAGSFPKGAVHPCALELLRSRTDQRPATEVDVAVHALNRMLDLGRPISVRIA